ncbi:MAG: hypothetical protein A2001_01485 [Treponema sp. GWC1_61_84]|nr:MAG: hypothetical protein A2001_01485 [Treponema sp. GWC1_61_84]
MRAVQARGEGVLAVVRFLGRIIGRLMVDVVAAPDLGRDSCSSKDFGADLPPFVPVSPASG